MTFDKGHWLHQSQMAAQQQPATLVFWICKEWYESQKQSKMLKSKCDKEQQSYRINRNMAVMDSERAKAYGH